MIPQDNIRNFRYLVFQRNCTKDRIGVIDGLYCIEASAGIYKNTRLGVQGHVIQSSHKKRIVAIIRPKSNPGIHKPKH